MARKRNTVVSLSRHYEMCVPPRPIQLPVKVQANKRPLLRSIVGITVKAVFTIVVIVIHILVTGEHRTPFPESIIKHAIEIPDPVALSLSDTKVRPGDEGQVL